VEIHSEGKARERSAVYRLLSQLYLHGLTKTPLAELVEAGFVEAIPDPFDEDEAAADHHALFGFNVFPYQSIFLDDTGLLGGRETERAFHSYEQAGLDYGRFELSATAENPDHIGFELAFLAFLAEQEARAWGIGDLSEVQRLQKAQAAFLRNHLLQWLSPFALAITQQRLPFWKAIADLTLKTTAVQAADLGDMLLSESRKTEGETTVPISLEGERTGLKEIAAHLLLPISSGIFLTRDDLARLARKLELPRGFGTRDQLLNNLMRAAVSYDRFELLVGAIGDLAREWVKAYEAQMDKYSAIASFVKTWHSRAEATIELLISIRKLAANKLET